MATFTVNNLTDIVDADAATMSLREALALANADPSSADDIVFAAGLSGTLTLVGGELTIDGAARILGPGADKITIDGGGTTRLILVNDGTGVVQAVTISGLTLTNGGGTEGAGIRSYEALTLDRVAMTNNKSSGGGSGSAVKSETVGIVTVTNSSFTGNEGFYGGAIGAYGSYNVSNSTFANNTATASGGGLAAAGSGSVLNSTFINNTAANSGGGIFINSASHTITNTILWGNVSNGGAGTGSALYKFTAGAAVDLTYSLIEGTAEGNGFTAAGTGNVTGGTASAYAPGAPTTLAGLTFYLPAAGSAVIDAGDPAYAGVTTDQRGWARVTGGRIDMGAVEYGSVAPGGAGSPAPAPAPAASPPPPTFAPTVTVYANSVLGAPGFGVNAPPATVTTPTGQVLPNPLLEQQKAVAALIARVDAGQLTLRQVQDIIVDMADATTSVASMSYQFFTGKLPTKDGLAFLVSSPQNPTDLNDGYYAGMSLENRYINFAVNLGKLGEGAAGFSANYGPLSLADATAKAYAEIFGPVPTGKVAAILTPERSSYFLSLGGDAIGQKAAMVGWLLGEAAKTDTGPYAARNENFLYDLLDGTAAFGADAAIYAGAGPTTIGLVGVGLGEG